MVHPWEFRIPLVNLGNAIHNHLTAGKGHIQLILAGNLWYQKGVGQELLYSQKTAAKISSVMVLSLRAESRYVQPKPDSESLCCLLGPCPWAKKKRKEGHKPGKVRNEGCPAALLSYEVSLVLLRG